MSDLFGDGQHSLFGDDPDRIPHPAQETYVPDPERIRQRLHAVLDRARAAPNEPWPEKKTARVADRLSEHGQMAAGR